MMKASKITLGLFSSGFVLFSIYKYFTQKRITKEQISKIFKKITNLSVYFMFQKYDSFNISQQKNLNSDKNNEKTPNPNFSEEKFDNEVMNMLNKIENEQIKSLNITKEEFEEYLTEYKNEDVEINKNFNLIQKVLSSLKKQKLPEINFGFIIPEKYLQIMSNIFYFNIKKAYKVYYNKINLIKNNSNVKPGFKEKKEIFEKIYNSFLKETRNEICYFFGVDKDNNLEINIKLALRIFPFYYDKSHNLREKYHEIDNNINRIKNIIIKLEYKLDVLTNEENKYYIKEPVDNIINFESILNNIYLKNNFNINNEENAYEDICD